MLKSKKTAEQHNKAGMGKGRGHGKVAEKEPHYDCNDRCYLKNFYDEKKRCGFLRSQTRAFDDPCAINTRDRESRGPGIYDVTGFYRKCGEEVYTPCMLNQPFVFSTAWGNVDQCEVDVDTRLRYSDLTNLHDINQLFTRPYVDSGYRGAGAGSIHLQDLESSLQQSSYGSNKKSAGPNTEINIDRFDWLPSYGNPQRVEHVVPVWTWGGVPSRDLVRRLAYPDYAKILSKATAC